MKRLKRENAELRRANSILKAAAAWQMNGFHLGDALPKLRGLADFTETCGSEFQRAK